MSEPSEQGIEDDAGAEASGGGRRWRRVLLVVLAVVVGFVAVVGVGWVVRYPEVEPDALAAVRAEPDLEVTVTDDRVVLAPATDASDTTVVFYPGAGVPPSAYLPTWAPVVAEVGATVVIPTMPLRLAVLDADAADEIRTAGEGGVGGGDGSGGGDDDPDGVATWWIGGHSLGGAMAASFLADEPEGRWDGLVLWAAYPGGGDLVDRDDLAIVSVSGTRDGLTTTEDVESSRDDLPGDADFVVLDGVNHAQFAAYGDQSGDGEASVDDDTARELIAEAMVEALDAE